MQEEQSGRFTFTAEHRVIIGPPRSSGPQIAVHREPARFLVTEQISGTFGEAQQDPKSEVGPYTFVPIIATHHLGAGQSSRFGLLIGFIFLDDRFIEAVFLHAGTEIRTGGTLTMQGRAEEHSTRTA